MVLVGWCDPCHPETTLQRVLACGGEVREYSIVPSSFLRKKDRWNEDELMKMA